jgi:death-on-curing protein
MESIELLCINDVLEIHKEAIEIFGGSFGYFRDTETMIKSVLDQQNPHFGYNKYPTPFNKAAMLWYFFHQKSLFCRW